MKFNADFHVHSRFSRATSRQCDLEHLNLWGKRKGLTVVGTGDFTHPGWFAELEEKLEPAEEGLYTLKREYAEAAADEFQPPGAPEVRFMLTVEISSIYKRHDRVRKVHNVLFAPSLEAAGRIAGRLDKIGNVRSDGRPILGLDSRDLLEITLESSDTAFLVPAHIWTPHFSMLGARSGFDTVEECFDDLADRIFAVETGLSSDPQMNWRLSELDRMVLISNSDAHSPSKLAREANMFDTELSFPAIRKAIEQPGEAGFLGTIEFFPEEGKYHLDGHRKCSRRLTPAESAAGSNLCPACGRPVTIGVLHRVEDLADRPEGARPPGRAPFVSLIPLQEVLGEVLGRGPATKTVLTSYQSLIANVGPEIGILKDLPLDRLDPFAPPLLDEAISRMRRGRVRAQAGFDGEFGVISLFTAREKKEVLARNKKQKTLF